MVVRGLVALALMATVLLGAGPVDAQDSGARMHLTPSPAVFSEQLVLANDPGPENTCEGGVVQVVLWTTHAGPHAIATYEVVPDAEGNWSHARQMGLKGQEVMVTPRYTFRASCLDVDPDGTTTTRFEYTSVLIDCCVDPEPPPSPPSEEDQVGETVGSQGSVTPRFTG